MKQTLPFLSLPMLPVPANSVPVDSVVSGSALSCSRLPEFAIVYEYGAMTPAAPRTSGDSLAFVLARGSQGLRLRAWDRRSAVVLL